MGDVPAAEIIRRDFKENCPNPVPNAHSSIATD
jgi:hypothetical protein